MIYLSDKQVKGIINLLEHLEGIKHNERLCVFIEEIREKYEEGRTMSYQETDEMVKWGLENTDDKPP